MRETSETNHVSRYQFCVLCIERRIRCKLPETFAQPEKMLRIFLFSRKGSLSSGD
jgi:hypothetical protein